MENDPAILVISNGDGEGTIHQDAKDLQSLLRYFAKDIEHKRTHAIYHGDMGLLQWYLNFVVPRLNAYLAQRALIGWDLLSKDFAGQILSSSDAILLTAWLIDGKRSNSFSQEVIDAFNQIRRSAPPQYAMLIRQLWNQYHSPTTRVPSRNTASHPARCEVSFQIQVTITVGQPQLRRPGGSH